MPWAAAGAIGGALITSSAASDAADGQQAASQQSNALQAMMYDNNVKLQAPTINAGNLARDSLLYRLGLSRTGTAGTGWNASGSSAPRLQTEQQIRDELRSLYTTPTSYGGAAPRPANWDQMSHTEQLGFNLSQLQPTGNVKDDPYHQIPYGGSTAGTFDEAAYEAAVKQRLAEQEQANRDYQAQIAGGREFGDLADPFKFKDFSYTGEDLYNDPSYLFRLQQGQKALDRQGAAAGRFLSGSQLQASSNYNQGAASQEFQNAYQRALGTFSTNEGNRFNAYQANFNNAVNPLLSLAGAATLGSQNLGNAGANVANAMGANLTANANAQGAAGIAGANAITNGLNNAVGGIRTNALLNNLLQRDNWSSINNNAAASGFGNTFQQNGFSLDQSYG
ncbi:hypothetical protein [Variovorax sp. UC122_21]|uniref:hypothetical protein n=1 Tax=Variovorax sp. UC122_21 TaxID=3374554 RepID=UPI003756446B